MKYVTYALLDCSGTPFYIGAGLPSRPLQHFSVKGGGRPRVNEIIKEHRDKGLRVTYKIIGEFNSKDEAFLAEKILIATIGKVENGGTLVNICDGGLGISGFKFSKSQNAANSLRQKARFENVDERKTISETTRNAMSHPSVKRKISSALLQKWQDKDYRKRQVLSHTGKKDSTETKEKKSKKLSENWHNGVRKGKYSDDIVMDVYSKKGTHRAEDVAVLYGMNTTYVHKIWRHERCVVSLKRLGII